MIKYELKKWWSNNLLFINFDVSASDDELSEAKVLLRRVDVSRLVVGFGVDGTSGFGFLELFLISFVISHRIRGHTLPGQSRRASLIRLLTVDW